MKLSKPIIIKSQLSHNTGKTGIGKYYVAEITGLDPTYTYSRKFLNREYEVEGSNTTWYSYWCEIGEDGFYEVSESNNYQQSQKYIQVDSDGSYEYIPRREMRKRLLMRLSQKTI